MAETVNSTAAVVNKGLRPYLSAKAPATIAPTRQPTKAVDIATPCSHVLPAIPKKDS